MKNVFLRSVITAGIVASVLVPVLVHADTSLSLVSRIRSLEAEVQRLLDVVRGMRGNAPTIIRIGTPSGQNGELYSGEAGAVISGAGFLDSAYLVRFEGRSTGASAVAGKVSSTTESIVFNTPALEPGEYLVSVVPTANAGKASESKSVPMYVYARPSFVIFPRLKISVERAASSEPSFLRVAIVGSPQNTTVSFWKVSVACSPGANVTRRSGEQLCDTSLRVDTAHAANGMTHDHDVFSATLSGANAEKVITILLRAYDDAGHIVGTDRQQVKI